MKGARWEGRGELNRRDWVLLEVGSHSVQKRKLPRARDLCASPDSVCLSSTICVPPRQFYAGRHPESKEDGISIRPIFSGKSSPSRSRRHGHSLFRLFSSDYSRILIGQPSTSYNITKNEDLLVFLRQLHLFDNHLASPLTPRNEDRLRHRLSILLEHHRLLNDLVVKPLS